LQKQFEALRVQESLLKVLEEAGPAYWEETRELLTEMNLQEMLRPEMESAYEEIRPILLREAARVRPRLFTALEAEGQATLDQVETEMQQLLEDRLGRLIRRQESTIKQQVDLTPQQVEELLVNMVDANQQALLNVVAKRWQDSQSDFDRIRTLTTQFPELPPMSEEELLKQTALVLVALMRYQLPEYTWPEGTELRAAAPVAPAQVPVIDLEKIIPWDQIPEDQREKVRADVQKAKQRMEKAAGEFPGPPSVDEIDWSMVPEEHREKAKKMYEEAMETREQSQE
jgi:hypothetical protein